MNAHANSEPCYCGSSISYQNCCFDLLNYKQFAQTAEQLMRSRYSAFCQKNSDYLLQTLAPNKHQPNEKELIQQSFSQSQWLGLKILDSQAEKLDIAEKTSTSWVEFVAFYIDSSAPTSAKVEQLHERSNFIKIDHRWYYVDGDFLPPIKLNRNDACFCGSGKKYKKCHAVKG